MLLWVLCSKGFVYHLHIVQHFFFAAFAGAFAKAAVVYQYYIVIVSVKIAGIFSPAFNASGIAMKIQDEAFRLLAVKMQTINAYTGCCIKKQFFKRYIVFKLKILLQLFGLKNKFLLQYVYQ